MSEQANSGQERSPQITEIARRNDEFRRAGPNRDWIATTGALALADFPGLVQAVRDFNTFTEDNDPFGEHDFGSIDWQHEKTFWKIDYYDQTRQYFADPLSELCRRVMTIMLAEDY